MKKAFTLSEVLITLSIVGLISIFTLPNVIGKVYSDIMMGTLKNTYSQLGDAIKNKMSDAGVYVWRDVLPDSDDDIPSFMQEFLTEYLDVTKVCHSVSECFAESYSTFSGRTFSVSNWTPDVVVLLSNGSVVSFYTADYDPSSYNDASFSVDVNGKSKPNILGVDYFSFPLNENGILASRMLDADDETRKRLCREGGVSTTCFELILLNNWEPIKF